jgi:IrrE N-terminal-like domain
MTYDHIGSERWSPQTITWAEAHRTANIAAAQAHYDLDVDTSSCCVDVAAAIARAETLLFWRPLPQLFGAYLNEPGSQPGIIVNSRLSSTVRRYTAAHELGHHRFGHASRVDAEATVQAHEIDDNSVVRGVRSTRVHWPSEEKLAESFAAWFLMPRRAVLAGLCRLNVERLTNAQDVYRLSLLLGAPYQSLVRHLPNIRVATTTQARAWARITPTRIKAILDSHVLPPPSRKGSVWLIDSRWDGETIVLGSGDRIVITAPNELKSSLPVWLQRVALREASSGAALVLECSNDAAKTTADVQVSAIGESPWRFAVRCETTPSGVDQHWQVDKRESER